MSMLNMFVSLDDLAINCASADGPKMVFAYHFERNQLLENLLRATSWVLYSAAFMLVLSEVRPDTIFLSCQGVSLISNHWISITYDEDADTTKRTQWQSQGVFLIPK